MTEVTKRRILALVDAFGPLEPAQLKSLLSASLEEWEVWKLTDYGSSQVPLVSGEKGLPNWYQMGRAAQRLGNALLDAAKSDKSKEIVIYGQAPLPIFTQLGFTISAWKDSDITLLNRRTDNTWDRIALNTLKQSAANYFADPTHLNQTPWAGKVAIFISSIAVPTPLEAIQNFFERKGESPIALVELKGTGLLDETNAQAAIQALSKLLTSQIPTCFPKQTGIAIFTYGPATLAYLVGRAINSNIYKEVTVAHFYQGEYLTAITLPFSTSSATGIEEEAEEIRKDKSGTSQAVILRPRVLVGQELPAVASPAPRLSDLKIHQYRRLSGINLEGLGRVNLLVGRNNAGKTSVLEAMYLLVAQNDMAAPIDLEVQRGRWRDNMPATWFHNQFSSPSFLEGTFGNDRVQLKVTQTNVPETLPDSTGYLSTVRLEAKRAGIASESTTHLFSHRARQTISGPLSPLCPIILSTPFSAEPAELASYCNELSIRKRSKQRVIEFVQKHIDPGLKDIQLVDEQSFMVSHSNPEQNGLDLSAMGDGIQRVFRIGLMFAAAAGGILLIDEVDNALHTELLFDFTQFIQELARDFDVQVLLTTHSLECVDAFVQHTDLLKDLVGYVLVRSKTGELDVRRFAGDKLARLVLSAGVDVRVLP